MIYRKKLLLALIQLFEGKIEKLNLQKLLFLFTQNQQNKSYDFVPYHYGCFSFTANADLTAMINQGIVTETKTHFSIIHQTNYLSTIKENDHYQLLEIKKQFGNLSTSDLMKYTYIHYPYWAFKSKKAKNILTKTELEKVKNSIPKNNKTILYTIGYEGLTLEAYLNRLLLNDIKVLVDVRNNPISMKYGFSKSQLKKCCESLDIQYLHFPEVGIPSQQRKQLKSLNDYKKLFYHYKKQNLPNTISTQETILNILKKHNRIALTCFEANINYCHRKHLAMAINILSNNAYEIKHI